MFKSREEKRAYNAAHYIAHREEKLAYERAYRATHREEKRAYNRAYNAVHPEKVRARSVAYYAANSEKVLARSAAYYVIHREEKQIRNAAYRATHRETLQANRISKKYGVSRQDAETLVFLRDGPGAWCDICRTTNGPFKIDHDHTTGKIRGLLCGPCNLILGHIEGGPGIESLPAMVSYVASST